MSLSERKVWFTDANILAYWVLDKGGVLSSLVSEFHLTNEFFEICSTILFLIKDAKTQDSTLLTTAIFNEADYFITKDKRLKKTAKDFIKYNYGLELINTTQALQILQREGL